MQAEPVDGRVGAVEDVEQAGVVVDDIAVGVQLQQPDGHRVGQPAQQLLPFVQRLLGLHLGGDVDDLDEHVVAVGVVEEVVQGRVDPHPASVLAPAPQPRLLVAAGCHDREPALHGASLVIGVDLVEHRVAAQLLGGVAEHLGERVVTAEHPRGLVLHQRAEPWRCGRELSQTAVLLGLLVTRDHHTEQHAVDVTQVDEM